jgi:hypothetical protein
MQRRTSTRLLDGRRPSLPVVGARSRARRFVASIGAIALASALAAGGVLLAATPATAAAPITVNQCNNILASPEGATTLMDCRVVVVNTISHGVTSSTTTVTRTCLLGPCSPGNGTFTTRSRSLVTRVLQCNGSGNDAAHRTTCSVTITNMISADTPGAEPLTRATSNQCVGSGKGGGGTIDCAPYPATTTGATITQCNGSGNGGGGTVHCTIPASTVSRAIPVRVSQCNGTANPGGSVLVCSTRITTTIVGTTSATGGSGSTATSGGGTAGSGSGSSSGTGSGTGAQPQVGRTPAGGVAAGEGSATSPWSGAALGGLLLGVASLLAVAGLTRRTVRSGRHS